MASTEPAPAAAQEAHDDAAAAPTESEPLLGRPGDATQKPDAPMIKNLWLGTGWLAQIGAILLVAIVWSAVFTHPTQPLFSPHPLLQSLGVFTVIQAILLLQPTTTPRAKLLGQRAHALLQLLSFLLFAAGVALIQVNKSVHRLPHLHSPHAFLGVAAAALLVLQYAMGLTMWALPFVWGGEARARAAWKYHRWAGYGLLALLLATVAAAAETDYNRAVMGIRLWAVLVAGGLVVAGVLPRVHLSKLGIRRG